MRLTATALATTVAMLVIISGNPPTLSGMSAVPPCEAKIPTPPTTTAPQAPTNLRIIGGLQEPLEDTIVSGPNAGPDEDDNEPAAATTSAVTAEPSDYYVALASRSDCFSAFSLRDAAQVNKLRNQSSPNMAYLYPNDPDPRRQDATRVLIPEGQMGPGVELRMPAGPSNDSNVLVTFDFWWGSEFNKTRSQLDLHKESPLALDSADGGHFIAMRTDYSAARAHEHNQPAGGPFVAMAYVQGIGKAASVKTPNWWVDTMTGFPRLRLPYGAPSKEQRGYVEGLAPVDTSSDPRGQEIGLLGDRWHRFWHYFERAPDQDWISTVNPGQARKAYRYSMWFADTQRGPIRVMNEAVISIPASDTRGIWQMAAHMGAGNSNVATQFAGRGPLVAYTRNWVALHRTSKAEVQSLLTRPVN